MENQTQNDHERDQRLLQRLLLRPVQRKSRPRPVLAFFSRGAWQGIGGVLSFFSLIVTIILTLYVYNLSVDWQTARISYSEILQGEVTEDAKSTYHLYEHYAIFNNGPSSGQEILVSIKSLTEIQCAESSLNTESTIKASRIITSTSRCDFYYSSLYPHYAAFIDVSTPKGGLSLLDKTHGPKRVEISGTNILVIPEDTQTHALLVDMIKRYLALEELRNYFKNP